MRRILGLHGGAPQCEGSTSRRVPNLVCVDEVDAKPATRAALNEELGFYPACTEPESVARHRREGAAGSASHAEYLRQYGPNGYRRNQYRHAVEQKRQDAVEAAGRAAVADLYE